MKWEVYEGKVDSRDELLARILDAAARIKKSEDQLRRTKHDIRTRVAKCWGWRWDFRTFIVDYNKSVIPVSQIFRLNMKLKLKLN